MEEKILAVGRRLDDYTSAHQREQEIALSAMDKRLESMNEFRAQMRDNQATFLHRTEWDTAHRDILNRFVAFESLAQRRFEEVNLSIATKVSGEKIDGVYRIIYMAVGMGLLTSIAIPIILSILMKR